MPICKVWTSFVFIYTYVNICIYIYVYIYIYIHTYTFIPYLSPGDTALHAAAANDMWQVVDELIELDADPTIENKQGKVCCMCVHAYVCMNVCIYVICIHVCMYVCVYVCM
jgi:hypothetical protein